MMVAFVISKRKHLKLASQPTHVKSKIVNEDLAVVQFLRKRLLLNKPVYCGEAIF